MIEIREYVDVNGNSHYGKWFNRLNATAAAKVATAVYRMEQGNFSKNNGNDMRCYDGVDKRF